MNKQSQVKKILLLSAVRHELACLLDSQGGLVSSWPKYQVYYHAVGVGLVAASSSLTEILAADSYDLAVFSGSCGAPSRFDLGSVMQPDKALLWQGQGDHYFPSVMEREFALDFLSRAQLDASESSVRPGGPLYQGGAVANPLAITSGEIPRSSLDEQGIVAENLEVAACAYVARRWQLSMQVFLAVSNHIGPQAHEQWLLYHQSAQKQSCSLLLGLLDGGFF
mgnify:CR=1 FL=1